VTSRSKGTKTDLIWGPCLKDGTLIFVWAARIWCKVL